jgi:hypothetical protein
MLRWLLAFTAMGLLGCSGAPALRVEGVGKVASATKLLQEPEQVPQAAPKHAGTLEDPAEPFSASWLEPEREQVEVEAWVNSDACPDPLEDEDDPDLEPYQAFIERELRTDVGGVVATMQIEPSFTPARSLSLRRRQGGSYVLRSVELTTNVWAEMMREMGRLQGDSIRMDGRSLEAGLANVTTSKTVRERQLDAATAQLITKLWGSVTARAQVVKEINPMTGKADGTYYEIRVGGNGGRTHSPSENSVLGDLVAATEHLEAFIQRSSDDDEFELEMARDLMRSALERTRDQVPCLKRL